MSASYGFRRGQGRGRGQERAATVMASLAMAAVLALTLAPKAALDVLNPTPAHADIGPDPSTGR